MMINCTFAVDERSGGISGGMYSPNLTIFVWLACEACCQWKSGLHEPYGHACVPSSPEVCWVQLCVCVTVILLFRCCIIDMLCNHRIFREGTPQGGGSPL